MDNQTAIALIDLMARHRALEIRIECLDEVIAEVKPELHLRAIQKCNKLIATDAAIVDAKESIARLSQ